METEAKKTRTKGGRPRKYASDEKRPTMAFRIRGGMHERLKASAEASDVSLSEEIERRLIRSFEMEAQIAALEQRIDAMEKAEQVLWPDVDARALGEAFAKTLFAARHLSVQGWREDPSIPLIVAGAMRRLLDRGIRDGGSLHAGLMVDGARVAATADSIAQMVGPALDNALPPLPKPALDVAQWTGRTRQIAEFRDAETGKVLETITGPEADTANPETRSAIGTEYLSALERFAPIRGRVDIELFAAYVMKDGSIVRVSLDFNPARPDRPAS